MEAVITLAGLLKGRFIDNMRFLKDIKLGVIGAGYRFPLALRAHRPDEAVYLSAVADPDHEALLKIKEDIPEAHIFPDVDSMLKNADINTVMVMSPDWLHEEHVLACFAAGKHVFLEKPMALTIEGCDRIIKASEESKCLLYVGHNMRHMGFIKKMKELIESGIIGEVKAVWCRHFIGTGCDNYFMDWHADRRYSNSLLLHKGSHDLDIIHWLGGSSSAMVNAIGDLAVFNQVNPEPADERKVTWPPLSLKGRNEVVDVEDISMMQMRLKNGVMACYQQCHFTPDNWRNYTIIGTKGRLENIGDRSEEGAVIKVWKERCSFKGKGDLEFKIDPDNRSGDELMLTEFIEFLRGESGSINSPLEARDCVATAIKATESLRQGGTPFDVPNLEV